MTPPPQSRPSEYNAVRALLVQWEDDDLGVGKEVEKLAAVLGGSRPSGYNFSTERWNIPTSSVNGDEPEELLCQRLFAFRRGAKEGDLLILYYGGHGGGEPQQLYWAANKKKDTPTLLWHNVQNVLLGCPADVLLIFDSCYASLAATNQGRTRNWMLGATTKESVTTGVAWNSFTSTLTRELERCANRYWDKRAKLSVQDLHSSFVRWDRDLVFTPVLVRLTDDHDCPPTDLTPLLQAIPRPGLSKTSTDPPRVPSAKPSHKTLAFLPKVPQDFTSPSDGITDGASSSYAKSTVFTPSSDYSLTSPKWGKCGLIPIYEADKGLGDGCNIDIVLVHGFRRHSNEIFTYVDSAAMQTNLWPRDVLAPKLAGSSVSPRMLVYSWNPTAQLLKAPKVSDMHSDLALAIQRVRAECPMRPLVFIGCGFGGMLIKQFVTESINQGIADPDFDSPIQACFFIGLPQNDQDPTAYRALVASVKAVAPAHSVPDGLFDSQASAISDTLKQFNMISEQWEVQCASFGSTESLPPGLHYTHTTKGDYRNSAQLQTHSDLKLVVESIHDIIVNSSGLRPPSLQHQPSTSERVYAKLKAYDTRFLVDDSDSMTGRKWNRVKKVMAEIASIAVKYDSDGVDVDFFNSYVEDKKCCNLKSIDDVMSLFAGLFPEGETPTADKLDEVLNEFCHEFNRNRNMKGLNLIVLTDGEPSAGQDVEAVLVKYAKKLQESQAPLLKVGVQFVQVGVDEGASRFLQKLDDDIQAKHGLDRDMVDTVPWVNGDQDYWHEKILLGGILKRYDTK